MNSGDLTLDQWFGKNPSWQMYKNRIGYPTINTIQSGAKIGELRKLLIDSLTSDVSLDIFNQIAKSNDQIMPLDGILFMIGLEFEYWNVSAGEKKEELRAESEKWENIKKGRKKPNPKEVTEWSKRKANFDREISILEIGINALSDLLNEFIMKNPVLLTDFSIHLVFLSSLNPQIADQLFQLFNVAIDRLNTAKLPDASAFLYKEDIDPIYEVSATSKLGIILNNAFLYKIGPADQIGVAMVEWSRGLLNFYIRNISTLMTGNNIPSITLIYDLFYAAGREGGIKLVILLNQWLKTLKEYNSFKRKFSSDFVQTIINGSSELKSFYNQYLSARNYLERRNSKDSIRKLLKEDKKRWRTPFQDMDIGISLLLEMLEEEDPEGFIISLEEKNRLLKSNMSAMREAFGDSPQMTQEIGAATEIRSIFIELLYSNFGVFNLEAQLRDIQSPEEFKLNLKNLVNGLLREASKYPLAAQITSSLKSAEVDTSNFWIHQILLETKLDPNIVNRRGYSLSAAYIIFIEKMGNVSTMISNLEKVDELKRKLRTNNWFVADWGDRFSLHLNSDLLSYHIKHLTCFKETSIGGFKVIIELTVNNINGIPIVIEIYFDKYYRSFIKSIDGELIDFKVPDAVRNVFELFIFERLDQITSGNAVIKEDEKAEIGKNRSNTSIVETDATIEERTQGKVIRRAHMRKLAKGQHYSEDQVKAYHKYLYGDKPVEEGDRTLEEANKEWRAAKKAEALAKGEDPSDYDDCYITFVRPTIEAKTEPNELIFVKQEA